MKSHYQAAMVFVLFTLVVSIQPASAVQTRKVSCANGSVVQASDSETDAMACLKVGARPALQHGPAPVKQVGKARPQRMFVGANAGRSVIGKDHRKREDACAGQRWPYLSDACIDQIVSNICKAGGGGSACDESRVRGLVIDGRLRAGSSRGEIVRALK